MSLEKFFLRNLFVVGLTVLSIGTWSCSPDPGHQNQFDAIDSSQNEPDSAGNNQPKLCSYQWDEEVKSKTDLSDIEANYSQEKWFETATTLLERIYPYGKWIVEQVGKADSEQWFEDRSTFDGIFLFLSTGVHEDLHILTANKSGQTNYQKYVFPVGIDRTVAATAIKTPPRLSIGKYVDQTVKDGNGMYKLYFTNDEEPGMADQDLFSTLDELNAYTTDELLGYVQSSYPYGIQSNCGQGLYSFMYFTELSLKAFRLDYPQDYARLLTQKDVLETILTLWSRANFVYTTIKDQNSTNTCEFYKQQKAHLVQLIFGDALKEIDRIRDAYCK
jgi:hypothetical protein